MHLTNLLTSAGAFVSVTSAAAAFSGQAYEISNLLVEKVDTGNTTIEFTVHDPDPLTNATEVCSGSWKTGSTGYPQGGYAPCSNQSFAWNMNSFTSFDSFVLGLEHEFTDPSVGDPPYDQVTTFGKANVTEPTIACTNDKNTSSCEQTAYTTIKAPIYASIAKR